MHFSFTESKSLPKSRLCVQTLYTYSGERSKGKGAEAFRGRASGNRQDKKSGHFGPDELPCVIIIVDPLARRVRETEAHVMLLIESSERDKVATATAHQPIVPACANVQNYKPYSP